MEVGDKVKFIKLLSEHHEDWHMNAMAFNYVRTLIDQEGIVKYVQKHYEDDGTKTFYIDVEFPCEYILKRANSIAFENMSR